MFRTANVNATSAGAFEGQAGCDANLHPGGCAGLRGNGLGDVSNSRVFSSALIQAGDQCNLALVVGNGLDPVKLYILAGIFQ